MPIILGPAAPEEWSRVADASLSPWGGPVLPSPVMGVPLSGSPLIHGGSFLLEGPPEEDLNLSI